MIVTYNWLKEFVDFDFSPEELSHRLTMAGLEVDSMEKIGEGMDSVIVARLLSVDAHPDADRLTVCQVDTGSETLQIICGAKNHKTGDLVALAQVGSILPGDFKIKKSKIRGQVSMGMLASEKELGLSEESEGILILPPGMPLGTPVFSAMGLKDIRYELGLTPNRGDCLSVLGVAREVAGMSGQSLRMPAAEVAETGEPIDNITSVEIRDPDLCPRYAARLIQGVQIGPSPTWLVKKLESVGLRSINNVVDVTNLILMELGHPLHAFDFNLLRGRRIVVKRSEKGQPFTTLDSQPRQLQNDDLTICDADGPVALAGIMGGENSEVRPETTDVLLESAYFNPLTIRRTAKRLGIHSESSHRFERGADIDMVPFALDRAASLIADLSGGAICQGCIDVYPHPAPRKKLTISAGRSERILGIKIESEEIARLLNSIGLETVHLAEGDLDVQIPFFRHDLEREIDLIEEVARLNGYDNIPVSLPEGQVVSQQPLNHRRLVNQVKDVLIAAGFAEIINYSFIAEDAPARLGLSDEDPRRQAVRILNPLTEEQSIMRTTLVPSMLETVARNLAYRSKDLRLFELRPVFGSKKGDEGSEEKMHLTAALCGGRSPENWIQESGSVDFYDLKGIAEELLGLFQIPSLRWGADSDEPFLHPGKSCRILSGKASLGTLGEVHPRILERFEIDSPVFLLDIDLESLFSSARESIKFTPLSRFPDVSRDSAFLLENKVTAEEIFEVIGRAKSRDVEDVILFDIYRGKGIPEGMKSVGVRVRYRSQERTLTDEEINRMHGKIIRAMQDRLQASLR